MFVKLSYQPPDIYSINRTVSFSEDINLDEFTAEAFEFAFEMVYGSGHHRRHRSGGRTIRKNGELFVNTFQGKLAEFGFLKQLLSAGIVLPAPNTSIWGKGIWDNNDFEYAGKKLSIKSAAFFPICCCSKNRTGTKQAGIFRTAENAQIMIILSSAG